MQRCGIIEVSSALESEEVTLILVLRESAEEEVVRLITIARERGIKVLEASENDMWRMARDNSRKAPPILALVGRDPDASTEEILSSGGLCWLLDGAKYPVNIGFTIRTAEVSGAKAVFIDGNLSHAERKAARRASMKADRFIPVHWIDGFKLIQSAKKSGFRVICLEDSGIVEPWEEDLSGNVILVVGGERDGISQPILDMSDSVIRIPMSGFVPSYNLQAPMAVVAAEALRQQRSRIN